MTTEQLYKITGTGWFFHDFYVMATSPSHAHARAMDLICAEDRAKSRHYARSSARDQVKRVELARDVRIVRQP